MNKFIILDLPLFLMDCNPFLVNAYDLEAHGF